MLEMHPVIMIGQKRRRPQLKLPNLELESTDVNESEHSTESDICAAVMKQKEPPKLVPLAAPPRKAMKVFDFCDPY